VSLGAPFWFDMLKKVMKIRASVAPQDSAARQDGKEAGNIGGGGEALPVVGGRRLCLTGPNPAVVAEAARFAQLSFQAYQDEPEFTRWLDGWGDGSTSLVEDGFLDAGRHRLVDTQLYVLASPGRVMVIFRGTQELLDWWTNAQARLAPMRFTRAGRDVVVEGAFVHRGFQTALQVAWTDILERLGAAAGEGAEQREVVFAGHSLGGALAVLAAMRWQWEKARAAADAPCYQGRLAGVYTIGQPRLGDEGFACHGRELLGDCYVRAVNNRDIVPRVPPCKVGFEHFGTLHYYDEGGTLRVDPSLLVRIVDVALADWVGERSAETLKEFEVDHSADKYVALYEKQVAALSQVVAA
jgi:hypothetical protein